MKILHICNDFAYSKVHTNLYRALDRLGCKQVIYHPLRKKENIGKNSFLFETTGSEIVYSATLKKYHRVLFRNKIRFLYKSLKNQIDFSEITIQHATTLFSDGAVAYKVYKEFGIPYTVTLRNTDINLFLKLRPDLYSLGRKILLHAHKVVFISPSLKELFFQHSYFTKLEDLIQEKTHTIPNGIDQYWIVNARKPVLQQSFNFLFIGRFDANKNVLRLIRSLTNCKKVFPKIKLILVGGGGGLHSKVLNEIEDKDWIKFVGPIFEKDKLRDIFRISDYFVMPSIYETFGLVYIEALSQGLPILYTKGQGVDGVIYEKVGIGTAPKDSLSIQNDILTLIENRAAFIENIHKLDFSQFNWDNLAKIYFSLFET